MQGRAAFLGMIVAVTALTGCRFGNDKPDTATGGTPAPAPTTATNRAPTISGTPPTTAAVNSSYSFTPTASDPDGDKLTFQMTNKPAWASFDTATGRLYGTPSSTAGGSFSNLQISVTDGKATASLPAFSIAVANAAVVANATLNWQAPTMNSDGTPLTDLAGYNIRYGNEVTALNQKVSISNPGITTYVIDSLPAGTWHFVLTSINKAGIESAPTYAVTVTIS